MSKALIKRYKTIKLSRLESAKVQEAIESLENQGILNEVGYEIISVDDEIHIILSASAEKEDIAKAMIKPVSKTLKSIFGDHIYSTKGNKNLEETVVKLLEEKELTISTAESCTGGLLAGRIINVPGVSEVFREGFVTYTNQSKRKNLNVGQDTLRKYGAVSSQTAKEMALGAVLSSGSKTALAVTGIAGPDGGTEEKPVGLVYIACYIEGDVDVEKHIFSGDRMHVREQSVTAALDLLRRNILKKYESR